MMETFENEVIEIIEGDRAEVEQGNFRWAILDGDNVDLSKGTFLSKPGVPCRRIANSYWKQKKAELKASRKKQEPNIDGLLLDLLDNSVFQVLSKRASNNGINLEYLFVRGLENAINGKPQLLEKVLNKVFAILPQSGDQERRRGLAGLARKHNIPNEVLAVILNTEPKKNA